MGGFFAKEVFVAGLTPPPGIRDDAGQGVAGTARPQRKQFRPHPPPGCGARGWGPIGSAPGPYREDGQDISAGPRTTSPD